MHQYKILKEIRSKAFNNFLSNPYNEEAKNLFFETNRLFLVTEADDDDEGVWDFDFEGEPIGDADSGDESGGFSIYGGDDDEPSQQGSQKKRSTIQIKLSEETPVDPPFGMKAGLCFDSVSDYELAVLKAIQNLKAGEVEKFAIGAGDFEPFLKDRLGRAKKKYADVLKDIESARESGNAIARDRKEFSYDSFIADEFGNIERSDLPKEFRQRFLPKQGGNLGNYISRNQLGATVTAIGAGQLEFLARIFYLASTGSHPGIASKIKVGGSVSRDTIVEQEKMLFKLAPSTVSDNCYRTLRDYLSHAVKEALLPIVRKSRINEFIEIGIDKVIDGISLGQYKFEKANLAAWSFEVIKNQSKDLLAKALDYKYDDSIASKWVYSKSFPMTIDSKANPNEALSLKKRKILNFSKVDTERSYGLKGESGRFFKYTYDNEYDLLEDLRISNGYYDDAEIGQKETAGRKKKILEQSPLYYKNLSIEFRKNFMMSMPKERFASVEDFPELSTAQVPVLDKAGREALALEVSRDMQGELNKVVDEIFNMIVSDNTNKYSQKGIKVYMADNPDLTKKLILGLLNFGVYKFERDHYNFVTNPELYLKEFLDDIYNSEFMGQKEVPQTITNKKGGEIPMYNKIDKTVFFKDLRRIILGAKLEQGEEIRKLAFVDSEQADEMMEKLALSKLKPEKGESPDQFKQRVLSAPQEAFKKEAGFFVRHPEILRKIYGILRKFSVNKIVGRRKPTGIDEKAPTQVSEQIVKIKSIISEIKSEFHNYKKQITKNFTKSWN